MWYENKDEVIDVLKEVFSGNVWIEVGSSFLTGLIIAVLTFVFARGISRRESRLQQSNHVDNLKLTSKLSAQNINYNRKLSYDEFRINQLFIMHNNITSLMSISPKVELRDLMGLKAMHRSTLKQYSGIVHLSTLSISLNDRQLLSGKEKSIDDRIKEVGSQLKRYPNKVDFDKLVDLVETLNDLVFDELTHASIIVDKEIREIRRRFTNISN